MDACWLVLLQYKEIFVLVKKSIGEKQKYKGEKRVRMAFSYFLLRLENCLACHTPSPRQPKAVWTFLLTAFHFPTRLFHAFFICPLYVEGSSNSPLTLISWKSVLQVAKSFSSKGKSAPQWSHGTQHVSSYPKFSTLTLSLSSWVKVVLAPFHYGLNCVSCPQNQHAGSYP